MIWNETLIAILIMRRWIKERITLIEIRQLLLSTVKIKYFWSDIDYKDLKLQIKYYTGFFEAHLLNETVDRRNTFLHFKYRLRIYTLQWLLFIWCFHNIEVCLINWNWISCSFWCPFTLSVIYLHHYIDFNSGLGKVTPPWAKLPQRMG